jgi:hypothetical protein
MEGIVHDWHPKRLHLLTMRPALSLLEINKLADRPVDFKAVQFISNIVSPRGKPHNPHYGNKLTTNTSGSSAKFSDIICLAVLWIQMAACT